jgi:hypothetical protein
MPPFLEEIREFNQIFNAEDVEIDNLKDLINKILQEVIVKTADSYGLEKYEKIYDIKNIAETLEARRLAILLKINSRVPYTLKWLINTLNEAIGIDNYKIITNFNNYEMNIKIALNYSEAGEILKNDLVQQIPANILLDYRLYTNMNLKVAAMVIQENNYIQIPAGIGKLEEEIELDTHIYTTAMVSIYSRMSI